MKVSTKGRYGLRALVDLAANSEDSHVTLASITQRQRLSLNYLEQVFTSLRKAGLVISIKGSQGGYILSRPASQILVNDILTVLEGEFQIVDKNLFLEENEDPIRRAIKELVWDEINEKVSSTLTTLTLETLVNEYRCLNNENPNMYYI